MLRRQSIGQEGTSAEFCDLSGRGLTTSQVERTLRVFDTAVAIDMSNNELEQLPTTIPKELVALDVSFNLLATANGLERLQLLLELNLGFNRLSDVTILEFCPLLRRVNLSGNRLMGTRGLESLNYLEHLDLSDNLIEHPEALRALSMNSHLTHLTIRGNPIAHKASTDCRVVVLDMIPSVLVLDDKKVRGSAKCKQPDDVSSGATTSLSYSRIYDDKKQFVVRHQHTRRTPATRPISTLLGDPTMPSKYEGNTIFLQSPKATTFTQDLSVPFPPSNRSPHLVPTTIAPPPAPSSSLPIQLSDSVRLASPTAAAAPYISLYDRLAKANGIAVDKSPPYHNVASDKTNPDSTVSQRPGSSQSRRADSRFGDSTKPSPQPRRSVHAGSTRPPSQDSAHVPSNDAIASRTDAPQFDFSRLSATYTTIRITCSHTATSPS